MSYLPAVNAALNALVTVLLITGLVLIKRKAITAHKRCMFAAFGLSCVFLISYVIHKIAMRGIHTPYTPQGIIRTAYYTMLLSHVMLAMTVPVLAVLTIRLGLARRDAQHRKLARITWPIWLYVSVTGVLIYVMLYHFNG